MFVVLERCSEIATGKKPYAKHSPVGNSEKVKKNDARLERHCNPNVLIDSPLRSQKAYPGRYGKCLDELFSNAATRVELIKSLNRLNRSNPRIYRL